MDTQSLINFKVSNRNISKSLDEERFYWIRIIKKYNQNFAIYSEQWKTVIEKTPVKTVKDFSKQNLQGLRKTGDHFTLLPKWVF